MVTYLSRSNWFLLKQGWRFAAGLSLLTLREEMLLYLYFLLRFMCHWGVYATCPFLPTGLISPPTGYGSQPRNRLVKLLYLPDLDRQSSEASLETL